ncbi:MAG: thermosome subunit alpha [Candidatus Diapherotrites archaeon]|nr:thermosome subunit alpha [Candidatus Diapherotrites archaeon]MDZ4256415.1 thermosome subunit alpha [archaeon]
MADNRQMNQPMVFLPEGSKRVLGRDAQRINILIAKAVANAVKSTLGPKGMDKMLVDDLGDVTISNDGATILGEMQIDHPAGKMMVEVAKTQDHEVGDGTTTAVVLAGALLQKAEAMLDDDIHPSIIINGYRMAERKAKEIAASIADDITFEDARTLKKIAMTSMTGKSAESEASLSDLVVEAVRTVAEKEEGKYSIDSSYVKLEKKTGGSLHESELIKGIVLDKEVVHPGMPRQIENAKIALIDTALEIKETETDAKIEITSPDQLQAFLDQEEGMLRKMVESIQKTGANVVVCQKGIDDLAQHFLSKEGILAVRRVKQSDLQKLAKSTGGKIVSRLHDISKEDLGHAKIVREKKISGDNMVFVEGCKNPKAVTILIRGGSQHVVDEAERAVNDALGSVSTSIKDGKIVSGGGSTEIEIAMQLKEFAKGVGGREQLAIHAFAEAMEIIPKTLAETAGMDSIDTLVGLRARHKGKEGKYMGVNVYDAKIDDMRKLNVIEPLRIKTQAITSASEVAQMILRIDDIIAATSSGRGAPPGGMPDMGGMDM